MKPSKASLPFTFNFPKINKIYPETIADKIVGVTPMNKILFSTKSNIIEMMDELITELTTEQRVEMLNNIDIIKEMLLKQTVKEL